MIKIMFVCHGNICRSPMAEFVFKDLIKKAGREGDFYVASSATSTEEIFMGVGNPVYPPARAELIKRGISETEFKEKRAVQLKKSDGDKYDLFLCMDGRNVINAGRILGSNKKIKKLMDFTDKGGDVADPWYSGDFETAYEDILLGCKAVLSKF